MKVTRAKCESKERVVCDVSVIRISDECNVRRIDQTKRDCSGSCLNKVVCSVVAYIWSNRFLTL